MSATKPGLRAPIRVEGKLKMVGNENLAESAKNGDTAAFSELYRQYYNEMYRYAMFMLGNAEEAEDVVMETVADAFFGIRQLRDAAKFKNWIFRILGNKAKRRRKKVFIERVSEFSEEIADTRVPCEVERIERVDLLQAMTKLTEEEREIVLLSTIAGYRSAEISEHLGINANTVRSKYKRALLKLRNSLEGEGVEK